MPDECKRQCCRFELCTADISRLRLSYTLGHTTNIVLCRGIGLAGRQAASGCVRGFLCRHTLTSGICSIPWSSGCVRMRLKTVYAAMRSPKRLYCVSREASCKLICLDVQGDCKRSGLWILTVGLPGGAGGGIVSDSYLEILRQPQLPQLHFTCLLFPS